MENENLLRDSITIGSRANESADLSNSNMKKEKDSFVQLRNEFKTAIKDLRNDVRRKKNTKCIRIHFLFVCLFQMQLLIKQK